MFTIETEPVEDASEPYAAATADSTGAEVAAGAVDDETTLENEGFEMPN